MSYPEIAFNSFIYKALILTDKYVLLDALACTGEVRATRSQASQYGWTFLCLAVSDSPFIDSEAYCCALNTYLTSECSSCK